MKIIAMIPARYEASRFPGKLMKDLGGKPVILRTYEAALDTNLFNDVFIVTDSDIIFETIENAGGKAIMSKTAHECGSDRIAEAVENIEADIVINVQGDEPLVNPKDIQKVIDAKKKYPSEIINSYTVIKKDEDENNINRPKVIFSEDKRLIYISRKAIPGFKEKKNKFC